MSESGGTSRASTRVRGGAPNKEQYERAKAKYKTFDERAKTECARVEAIHATKPFTPTGNPYEYAVLYHLTQLKGDDRNKFKCIYFLKIKGDDRRKFCFLAFLCNVLIRMFSSCTRTSFCSFSEKSFCSFSESCQTWERYVYVSQT